MLRTKAELALGKKHLKLVTAKNRVLVHENKTLEEAEIQHGDCVIALALQPQVAATLHGFAAILADGSVACWCEEDDVKNAQSDTHTCWTFLLEDTSFLYWRRTGDHLTGVKHIQSTAAAFAAIMEDGSVVTWGNPYRGGHSSAVQDQLKGVEQIQATGGAFAAILEDGTVVTWGAARYGGDSSAVRDQLKGVKQLQVTFAAFAAIKADGSVITWGDAECGGDSSAVQDQLKGVLQIQSTADAFAAILADGSVVAWGDETHGGDGSMYRQDRLKGVVQIQATSGIFAAIMADGSAVVWPDTYWEVPYPLMGIRQIQSTADAFAAIREGGSVVTWGDAEWGGDSSAVRDQLHSVQQIQATMYGAFAAIREDGSVVTWGHAEWGGDSSAVRDQLKGVTKIKGTLGAFAAILEDGSVVSWGHKLYGSDSAAVQDQLKGVQDIQVTGAGFAAIREDGSVLCWGIAARTEQGNAKGSDLTEVLPTSCHSAFEDALDFMYSENQAAFEAPASKALLLLKIADILQISSLFEAMGRRIEAGIGPTKSSMEKNMLSASRSFEDTAPLLLEQYCRFHIPGTDDGAALRQIRDGAVELIVRKFQPFLTNSEMKTALLRLPARVLVEILDADELLVASEDHLLLGQTSKVVTIFGASKSVA
eukprot:symbB.v1.2.026359.t1/scaffold2626.1/size122458/9